MEAVVTADVLEGWKYYGTCTCYGANTKKYKRNGYTLYLGATHFRVKKNGVTIKQKTHNSELENYLSFL